MSGSYDESAGADDTMDSFWEVQTHQHIMSVLMDAPSSPLLFSHIDLASEAKQSHCKHKNEFSDTEFLQKKIIHKLSSA